MIVNNITHNEIAVISNWEHANFSHAESYTSSQLENMFNNKDYQIFGAYNDDILCGYLIVHIGDKIDIEKIFVDKNFRKQGIGTMLIKHIINSFSNKKIILEVNENNTIAISFYKALGFKLLTTRKDYYGVNENAIILER